MRTDRRTDMTKLTVAFRNFANAPEDQSRNDVQGTVPVCSQVRTKHVTQCEHCVECFNIKTYCCITGRF